MLIPAILRADEIQEEIKKFFYTDDMMYEAGGMYNWIPDIEEESEDGCFQFAIVDSGDKLLGYLTYKIDWYSSCASQFGIISFDRGNPIVGKDLYTELQKMINDYHLHRIEWRMVGGNPVEKSYDKFCNKYNGTKHVLKDAFKDKYGEYHDNIIYEILL